MFYNLGVLKKQEVIDFGTLKKQLIQDIGILSKQPENDLGIIIKTKSFIYILIAEDNYSLVTEDDTYEITV